jgi:hypothetical protein
MNRLNNKNALITGGTAKANWSRSSFCSVTFPFRQPNDISVANSAFKVPSTTKSESSRRAERVAHCPLCRHPCKSSVKEKKNLLTRATEERVRWKLSEPAARTCCLSAVVPAFAEPDIHSLSQIRADRHRRLSLCFLPVLKQFEESLGSF